MVESIKPIGADARLAQLLGDDFLAQQTESVPSPNSVPSVTESGISKTTMSGSPFEDMLSRAVEAMNGVSRSEMYTNQLIDKYLKGEVGMQEVMIAQSKSNILVQLAVTTINTAVTTFKEITQMQV